MHKIQNHIQVAVHSFGKLMNSWNSSVIEMDKLFLELINLSSTARSIDRNAEYFVKFAEHPDLSFLLIGKLGTEIENILKQLKSFWY